MTITTNLDPDELVVAGTGNVFVAPEGTALPTDIDDVVSLNLDPAFVDLGYMTEDGVAMSFARTTTDKFAWQEFDPVRTLVTEVPKTVKFVMEQWNSETLKLGLGGATITWSGGGVMIVPEEASFIDIRALIVYAEDGDKHYAACFRRTQNVDEFSFPFKRTDTSDLPIGLKVLGAGDEAPYHFLTDDPAFEQDGS